MRGQTRAVFPPRGVYPEEQMAWGGSRVAHVRTSLRDLRVRREEARGDVKRCQVCLPMRGFFFFELLWHC